MKPVVTMREALADERLLGTALDGDSWLPWRTLLIAANGEALTDAERVVFKRFTKREREPGRPVEEFVAVKGRRGGGSRAAAVVAAYKSGLCTHPALVKGERGICLVVAADQRQADVILDYAEAIFRGSPVLAQLIESRTARELKLTNGITIEVRAADHRRLRGITIILAIADEVAFFATAEGAVNLDHEILEAVRPALATVNGQLFLISSPYSRTGELWRSFNRHYGPNGDPLILVAQGSSREFNSTLPQSVVDRAMERDPASASAEYGAEFRRDIESFVSIEAVKACVSPGILERAPASGVSYVGFTDPSGGSANSTTLAVGHEDRNREVAVVDCIRETRPPFSPESVCEDFARVLRSYGVARVNGDRFAGVWPVEAFARCGVKYEQNAEPKSTLYQGLLPALNSRKIDLLDNQRLVNQLVGLERRTARGGRDSIDHAPGSHDDLANAVAGLCAMLPMRRSLFSDSLFQDDAPVGDPAAAAGPQSDCPWADLGSQTYDGFRKGEDGVRYPAWVLEMKKRA